MKKNLPVYFLIIAFFTTAFSLKAQTVSIVPNPNAPDIFVGGSSGALSGYAGNSIVLNNELVLEYNASGFENPASAILQLAVYTAGDSLHLIPNPDAGQGVYFDGVQIVFNSKLFFIYLNASGVQQLASFDGTSIILYPNPDASTSGYVGSPRILNNTLYLAYINAAGVTQLAKFNGTGITLIPNPDNSVTAYYNNYSVVFDNKICTRYVNASGVHQVATYDGTSWTLYPNPDNTTVGVIASFPTLYKNKLYFNYLSATNQYQLLQFDGSSNPALIANPEDESATQNGYAGLPIVYNDTLFIQYENAQNILQLAKFGGTTLTLVPNPDASPYAYYNTPVVYNDSLYIYYVTSDGLHHLTQYENASNSLKIYPNPDGGNGYWDQPIVYGNNLYFIYYNAAGLFQLGYFNGKTLNLIANPGGIYNGTTGSNGYTGFPILWNNLLYMQFGSVPYGNAGNLGIFDQSSLPVTLLNFTAKQQGKTSLLQWSTSNEIDNKSFEVQRSADDRTFTAIGSVAGHGSVSSQQKYSFVDNTPLKGMNYYRLKQINNNGNADYTKITTVNFASFASIFAIYPNPAKDVVTISLPLSSLPSALSIADLNGKKLFTVQSEMNASSQQLDVSKLAPGIYHITLTQGTDQQTIKLIKE